MQCLVIDRCSISLIGFITFFQINFPDWTLVTTKSPTEGIELLRNSKAAQFNVLIIDSKLCADCEFNFINAAQQHSRQPNFKVVVLGDPHLHFALPPSEPGANAFLNRESSEIDILDTLSNVGIKPPSQATLALETSAYRWKKHIPNLTNRQCEIVDLLLAGHSNMKIATLLDISYGTVKNYMYDIMRIADVRSRLELVAKINNAT